MNKRLPLILLITFSLIFIGCSNPEEDDVTAPAAPSSLAFDANLSGDGQVYITWEAPEDNDVEVYKVYRNPGTGTYSELITVSETFYLDSGLDYSIEYSYKVTAIDDSENESPFSNEVSVTPLNLLSPSTPVGLDIQAHNIVADFEVNVELTWTANVENDFSHYKIYRSATSPLFAADAASFLDSVTGIFYIDEDVTAGNTYHYKLIAYDLGGKFSDPTIVVSDTPLEVPTLTRPTEAEEGVSLTPTFEWTNVGQAVKYKIVVRTSSQSGDIWEEDVPATTATSMSVNYPATATTPLETNTRYFWFVAGYSQDNEEVNVYSVTSNFRTQ